jgi:DNA polymerase III delta prime subunit
MFAFSSRWLPLSKSSALLGVVGKLADFLKLLRSWTRGFVEFREGNAMTEVTSTPQNPVIVWPLYLPQIYWLLLRNKNAGVYSKYIMDKDFVPRWEQEFTKILEKIGFVVDGPFWDEGFSKKVAAHTSFESKKSLSEFIESGDGGRGMTKLFLHTARVDRKTLDACEAMGLIQFRSSSGGELRDTEPSKFFDALLEQGGGNAAVLLLGRLLSLKSSTIQGLLNAPRKVIAAINAPGDIKSHIKSDVIGKEHWHSVVRIFLHAVTKKPLHGENKLKESEPYEFAIDKQWLETLPAPTIESSGKWRDELPPKDIIEAIQLRVNMEIEKPTRLCDPQNVIFQGPPGTGKTRAAVEVARRLTQATVVKRDFVVSHVHAVEESSLGTEQISTPNLRVIQFHPSYGYEDFVEGLRPVKSYDSSQAIRYAIVPGPLKAMAHLARAYWDAEHDRKKPFAIGLQVYRTGDGITVPKEFDSYGISHRAGELFDHKGVRVATTGEGVVSPNVSYNSDIGYLEVQWKPSIKPGETTNFVLVIDELNRGNPAKVFGELLYLLERSKRLDAKSGESAPILLPYSKEEFVLPLNFHVLCTMNPADRSLAPLDQAFRRRFETVTLLPRLDLIRDGKVRFGDRNSGDLAVNKRVASHIEAINATLKQIGISSDRHIGHFYPIEALGAFYRGEFRRIEDSVASLWNLHLHSLIRELIGSDEQLARDFAHHFKTIYEEMAAKAGTRVIEVNGIEEALLGSAASVKAA